MSSKDQVKETLNKGKDAANEKAGQDVVTEEHVNQMETAINDAPNKFREDFEK